MKIEITAIGRNEKEILLNLMEKYEYELSQYFVHYVNELGLYGFENLDGLDDFYHKNAKGWVLLSFLTDSANCTISISPSSAPLFNAYS